MVLCWWRVVLVLCWWCCVDGVWCWWCVVCCWWCVVLVLCWWCCVDDVCVDDVVLMELCWWWCVDGDVLMMVMCWWCLCWWCCVDGVVWMVLCWWGGGGGGGGMEQEKKTRGNMGNDVVWRSSTLMYPNIHYVTKQCPPLQLTLLGCESPIFDMRANRTHPTISPVDLHELMKSTIQTFLVTISWEFLKN